MLLCYYYWAESLVQISAGLAISHHFPIKLLLPISNFDRLSHYSWSDPSASYLLEVLAIDLNMVLQPKPKANLPDAINQKARRRRNTLFKKASEYSLECNADIHLVLRMKKSGIFILTSNSNGWPLSDGQLVSFSLLSISSPWRY